MRRTTNQKTEIIKFLKSVKTHPTADDVYIGVKKIIPNISIGTVYRNLNKFSKTGEILEIKGKVKRFDGDTSFHNHFICEKCKKVYDIFEKNNTNSFKNISDKAMKIGKVKNCQIYFYGICNKCK